MPLRTHRFANVTMLRAGPPRLRDSQRQLIVFLDPGECDLARAIAHRHRLTFGETLALAVNAEMRSMGLPDALTPARLRQFQRTRGAAAPRSDSCPTPARRGRKSVAAWYDRREVSGLRDVARECGRSLQDIARCGIACLEGSEVLGAYVSAGADSAASLSAS
jgi:hypothetical protein